MTVVVATLITAMPNGLCEVNMFVFLNVDRHGTGSVLLKIIPQDIYIYILSSEHLSGDQLSEHRKLSLQ